MHGLLRLKRQRVDVDAGLRMSSNRSFQYDYDVNLDDLPFLKNTNDDNGAEQQHCEEEAQHLLLCWNLMLIELSSCFCNGPKLLFNIPSLILWGHNQT